jgi:hypothetical protein
MKKYFCLLVLHILLNSCTWHTPKQDKDSHLKPNNTQLFDTIQVVNNQLTTNPFQKEPELLEFDKRTDFKKSIVDISNPHNENQIDQLIEFARKSDKVTFYKTNDATFLKSISVTTNYGYFLEFLSIDTPIDLLLTEIHLSTEKANFVLIIKDEEEYSQICINVANRKIVKIALENVID